MAPTLPRPRPTPIIKLDATPTNAGNSRCASAVTWASEANIRTPATDILGYAKYSRGYKAGGFNSGINAVNPETSEETVDAFEVGYKETFGRTFQTSSINGPAEIIETYA